VMWIEGRIVNAYDMLLSAHRALFAQGLGLYSVARGQIAAYGSPSVRRRPPLQESVDNST